MKPLTLMLKELIEMTEIRMAPLSFQQESLVIILSSGAWDLLEVIMLQPRYLRTQSSDLYEDIWNIKGLRNSKLIATYYNIVSVNYKCFQLPPPPNQR